MRLIPQKVHALLDYALGVVAIVLPLLLDFGATPDQWGLSAAGGVLIVYSLFTNYEYSISRWISFNVHLILDICLGLVLIGLAFVLDLTTVAIWLYVAFGAMEVLAGLLTHSAPRPTGAADLPRRGP